MSQKPATIKEIAKRLNVSISTVSRALHNHHSIGIRTRMQIKQLAEELQYEPNQAAISFKQGKTCTLGVILPNLGEDFFSTAITGIEETALQNGYSVLIGQSHDNLDKEKRIVDTMRRHRVDGILVSLSKHTDTYEHFDQLKKYSIPVVFFDRVPDVPDAFTVSCDLKNSSARLVDWLVSRGHQFIGFIKGPDTLGSTLERLAGYLVAMKKNNIRVDESYIVQTDLGKEKTRIAMQQLLDLKNKPTAVIAFNDYIALDAIHYCKTKGIKVNRDIYFASYANLPLTHYVDTPPLISVEQFPYLQAEKATAILLDLIHTKNTALALERKIVIQSSIVIHDSLKKKCNEFSG